MNHLNQQDLISIKTIAEKVKDMTVKFDLGYDQSAVEELLYDIGNSMREIVEIINNPSGTIDRSDEELRCNTCYRTIDSYFYRYSCKYCYDRGIR